MGGAGGLAYVYVLAGSSLLAEDEDGGIGGGGGWIFGAAPPGRHWAVPGGDGASWLCISSISGSNPCSVELIASWGGNAGVGSLSNGEVTAGEPPDSGEAPSGSEGSMVHGSLSELAQTLSTGLESS